MGARIQDVPVFAARPDRVPAVLYNLWRRARMRLGTPLEVDLPGLKEMLLVLEHDAWVVVDRNRGEVPVLAWVDFRPGSNRGLHEPVECTLNYYHFLASGVRGRVLARMEDQLEAWLRSRTRWQP